MFNIFRLAGDFLHLASIILLLVKIRTQRSVAGISLKTQVLYCIVFVTRYLDVFWNFVYLYNTVMKIIYLGTSFYIVHMGYNLYKHTYDKDHDSFRIVFLIAPCALLALIFNAEFALSEILWTFSIYLEAVAILPQLFLLMRTSEVENITSHYIFALGGYRACYLMNWVYRVLTEPRYSDRIVWVSGVVQTLLYLDFFYYYLKSIWYGRKLVLPTQMGAV